MENATENRTSEALGMQVFLSPPRIIQEQRTFAPVTSTLFTGSVDAILVDAQFYREDVEALIDIDQPPSSDPCQMLVQEQGLGWG